MELLPACPRLGVRGGAAAVVVIATVVVVVVAAAVVIAAVLVVLFVCCFAFIAILESVLLTKYWYWTIYLVLYFSPVSFFFFLFSPSPQSGKIWRRDRVRRIWCRPQLGSGGNSVVRLNHQSDPPRSLSRLS